MFTVQKKQKRDRMLKFSKVSIFDSKIPVEAPKLETSYIKMILTISSVH